MPDAVNGPVPLPAIFDLDSLDPVRDAIARALETGPVEVVGNGVDRVATNALFLLLAAADAARMADRRLTLVAPSEALSTAVVRLGLSPHFQALIAS